MNYNALLFLDKKRKYRNNYSIKKTNLNQYSFSNQKINNHLNGHTNVERKNKKCFSVKPSLYTMPKDIVFKDIFNNSINCSNDHIKKFKLYNTNNNSDINRKYIFDKIKKFITINNINSKIFGKTIYLYDYLLFEKQRINKNNKKYENFCSLPNLSIAIISFILNFKFNYLENKMISLKSFVKYFEEKNEKITFNDICEMEIVSLQLIDYNLTFLAPFSFMELFLINGIIFSDDNINGDLSFKIYESVNETLENIMVTSNEYFKYNYFYLCCSTVMYVREKFKIVRWPKALEISFKVNYNNFSDIYNNFYAKNNKKENQNNIKSSINSNIINISNLKSISNILNVLKIIKSEDKYRKTKEKINNGDNHKEEEKNICQDNNNNNINENISNKIKVGLNKNWNINNFRSPEKNNVVKSSVISSAKRKVNEETRNKDNEDIAYNNKSIERIQIKKSKYGVPINKENYNNDMEKSNYNITKSCSRCRKTVIIINKLSQESYNPNRNKNNKNANINNISTNNISNLDSCYNNNSTNINYYKRRRYMVNKGEELFKSCPEINKELISTNNNTQNSKVNSTNNNNSNDGTRIYNKYYSNYTEKRRNLDNNKKKNNDLKINQTSFNDVVYYKNTVKKQDSNNDTDNENYSDNYKLKNKEENSNAPTCENSNNKLSLNNDYSIRKSYRYKKRFTEGGETEENQENQENQEKDSDSPKNEKNVNEEKKILEKNKSFGKLVNNKMTYSDNTYNRRIGVRKYYKQKKTRDYQ